MTGNVLARITQIFHTSDQSIWAVVSHIYIGNCYNYCINYSEMGNSGDTGYSVSHYL